jgi:vacuolar-type H+-ATPase subunit H
MIPDDNGLIEQVKAAEAAARQEVKAAEEGRRQAVAEAGVQAAQMVAETRTRLQQELAEARKRAEIESEELLLGSAKRAHSEADRMGQVPQDQLDRAVAAVTDTLKKRWQSTE